MTERNKTKKFIAETMQDLAGGDAPEGFEIISDEIVDTDRWHIIRTMIFKFEEVFYSSSYSRGATEYQDTSPYEDEGDMITVYEVVPVETTVIVYKSVKEPT